MEEIWKKINDKYEVSSLGRVRGPRGSITKGVRGSRGYMQITMNRKTYNIHVLVALLFIGDRPKGYYVCHNDGDKTNNSLNNLRYDTAKSNWEDFRLNPQSTTHAIARATCPLGHKLEEPNLMESQKKRGWRSCLACGRAHAYKRNGRDKESYRHEELANKYYERIISENS